MQVAYYKHILFGILGFLSFASQAQTQITFQSPEGFAVKNVELTLFSPFAARIFAKIDSLTRTNTTTETFGRLIASAIGFEKLDTIFSEPIVSGQHLLLTLKPKIQLLEEVVISTSKSGIKLKESPVSITILKPYLVQNKITADLSQVLDQVPGVSIADNQINIRNGTGWSYGAGSRVAVLVDDLPMLSADAASPQFSFMPTENIGSIEIVKSAGSVLYGSSALNGIVNLRTAEPTEKPNASIAVFTGIYGNPPRDSMKWSQKTRTQSGLNGFYSKKTKGTSIAVSWNILADEGYRLKEVNYRGRISFRMKRESKKIVGLNYGINTAVQRGFSGSFLLWQSYAKVYTLLDSGYTYTNTSRASIDPFLTYTKGKTTHKYLSRIYILDNAIDNGNPTNNQSNGSSLWYNEYKVNRRFLADRLSATAGAVSMFSETHSPLFSGHQTSRNLAVYTQVEYKLKRLILTTGARYEYFKLNNVAQAKPVFRAGVNYALTRFTNIRASYGQGFRFPSMAEAFTTTTVGALTIFPNANLKPETGNSAEIGIKQAYKIGGFMAYLDVAVFRMDLINMMEFTFAQWGDISGPLLGLGFKSINVAKCRITGYEFETGGEGKIGKFTFNVLGGYTFSNPVSLEPNKIISKDNALRNLTYANTRADDNKYLKYRYKHLAKMDIQVRYKKIEIGIGLRYNSAMLNIDKAFVEQPFDLIVPEVARARKALQSTLVFDSRLAYSFTEKLKFSFQVLNLLNREYMARPCDIRPPRSFQVQMVWKL